MSLATRCPSCSTTFRVVQDQLKVCDGWVRCGRCDEVFSALEALFDLEREGTQERPHETERAAPQDVPGRNHEGEASVAVPVGGIAGVRLDNGDGDFAGRDEGDCDVLAPGFEAWGIGPRVSSEDRHADGIQSPRPFESVRVGAGSESDASGLAAADDLGDLEFVRHAQRKARWASPGIRIALAGMSLSLLCALAAQVAHHYRDDVVSRWPDAKPAVSAWCAWANCTVGAPLRLEDIVVESSTLSGAGTPDAFWLAVALRNRGTLAVAMPDVELSLTDSSGRLLARRALTLAELRASSALLQPGADSTLRVPLIATGLRVTGYTVEIFYP